MGLPARESFQKKSSLRIIIPIILIIIVIAFPTPHERMKQESYIVYETVTKTDLYETLVCSNTLQDGYYMHWDLTDLPDLPDNLKIIISVSSTEEIEIYIKSVQDVEYLVDQNKHDRTLFCNGPSLYVEVRNPSLFGLGKSAIISGDIKIFHQYEVEEPITKYRMVPITEWLPWWMS